MEWFDRLARYLAGDRRALHRAPAQRGFSRRNLLAVILPIVESGFRGGAAGQAGASCVLDTCGAEGCPERPVRSGRQPSPPAPALVQPFGETPTGTLPRLTCGSGCCCHTDAFYHEYYAHDYAASGATFPIYAAAPGRVFYRPDGAIHLQHDDFWQTVYAHVDPASIVHADGTCVQAGEQIAVASNAGTMAVHLHFELRGGSRNTSTSCANASFPIPRFTAGRGCPDNTRFNTASCTCEPAPTYQVDMGNPESESQVVLSGWGEPTTLLEASADPTARFQRQGGRATVVFPSVVPGTAYTLTVEVDDGRCDDSFQIAVDDHVLLDWTGLGGYVARTHTVTIPAERVTAGELEVEFRNTSTMACGLAGVYNMSLKPA